MNFLQTFKFFHKISPTTSTPSQSISPPIPFLLHLQTPLLPLPSPLTPSLLQHTPLSPHLPPLLPTQPPKSPPQHPYSPPSSSTPTSSKPIKILT
ncbi:unnamed protein product [Moneuplotes crassus]|uniref:Uncharacterized protein n=1 Tax=Euplotes crassus TaxID=5936 RepID=A0AAD1XHC4_EUPCR|nr:unnamed protein product [Moneuplotes crassus]